MLTERQDQEITELVNEGIEFKKGSFYMFLIMMLCVPAVLFAIDRNMFSTIGLIALQFVCLILSIRFDYKGNRILDEAHSLYHEYVDANRARRS